MGTKRSFIEVVHDEGYGDDLLFHVNAAFRGKDMRAENVYDGDLVGAAKDLGASLPLLSAMLPEIRIFGCPQDGTQEQIERYCSASVPRIGDHICVQHWTCEVYKVEWTIINGCPHADVFCDTSKTGEDLILSGYSQRGLKCS